MSDIAIKVENLGKKYIIRHEKQEPYKTFQDVLVNGSKKIITSLNPFNTSGQSDETTEEFWALKDINFEIKKGDKVGIIGRNGAGKSTLLKVLSRITEPTTGKIHINGRIASLLEVGTGFHPELTGRENIFLNGAILGMSRAEIKAKFDEIVAFAEVEKFLDTPVKRYSSGMYVRLAFSVAAHLEPEILVVDEVLAVGDVEFQKKCLGKMSEVSQEGRTVLFVSHNMNAVEQLCNCAILLEQGRIKEKNRDMQKLIREYTLPKTDTIATGRWINTRAEYSNPYFLPIQFSLLDDEGNVLKYAVSNDCSISVYIEGEINRLDKSLQVGYAAFDEDNHLVYVSTFSDQNVENIYKIKKGINRFLTHIPKYFFNEGTYRLELLVSLHNKQWIVNPEDNAPFIFMTIQGISSQSPYWTRKRRGILAPSFDWKVY